MSRGRPRQFDTEKALDAALLLFWHRGYEGTSLSALTKSMRINVPSLYAAFGNKEMLFKKALERYLQKPASYLPRALEQPNARRAVERLFKGAIDMVMNPGHADGCLLVQGALAASPAAASIRNKLSLCRAAAEAAVRRRFERAIAEGDLPANVSATKLARYIITVLWGLSVQAASGATRAQLRDVAKMALQCWPRGEESSTKSTAKTLRTPREE
jgi:AcrR family transcriptional regulator